MRTIQETCELVDELRSTIEYRVVVQAHDDEAALDGLLMLGTSLEKLISGLRERVALARQALLFDALAGE